jgi:hypothetical protein
MTDESTLLECFLRAHSSHQPTASMHSFEILNQELERNPQNLLINSLSILMNPTYPLEAHRMASIAISTTLKAKNPHHLHQIRQSFDTNLSTQVKTVISTTILSDDVSIRNQAAQTFALLFSIEGESLNPALNQICQNLADTIDRPIQSIGFLSIFLEILHLPNFRDELRTPGLMLTYGNFWLQALQILGFPNPIDLELRYFAAQCVCDAIVRIPEICQTENFFSKEF